MRQKSAQTNAVATSRTTTASIATLQRCCSAGMAKLGERGAEEDVPVEPLRVRERRVAAGAPLFGRRERAADSAGQRTGVVRDDLGTCLTRELVRVWRHVRQHGRQAGRNVRLEL